MSADKTTARALLELIVSKDPLTWSAEGIDDGCYYCGADVDYSHDTGPDFAHHDADCPWILSMRYLGRDIGPHTVEAPDPGQLPFTCCGVLVVESRDIAGSRVLLIADETTEYDELGRWISTQSDVHVCTPTDPAPDTPT